jgi:hypothetical protein
MSQKPISLEDTSPWLKTFMHGFLNLSSFPNSVRHVILIPFVIGADHAFTLLTVY